MTVKRVKAAAAARGIYFDGVKKYRNSCIGRGYEIYTPDGRGFFQADTLSGLYKKVMSFKKVKEA